MVTEVILWTTVVLSACGAIVFLLILVHRLCLRLESKGLLYYRNRPDGSMGGAGVELDRLIRPSVEHQEVFSDAARVESKSENNGE